MSMFNVNQNHPLIEREQTFFLDRKLISFHSYDRDIKKWPNANNFEIILPESLDNVQSIRLDTISLPTNQYVFTNENQNKKLSFSLEAYSSTQKVLSITIDDGTYTATELALEIQTKMNSAVAKDINGPYDKFRVKYNSSTNTMWFGNIMQAFVLRFDIQEKYDDICNGQKIVFEQYTRWGLPAYLGYKKAIYTADVTPASWDPTGAKSQGSDYGFDYEYPTKWLDNTTTKQNYFVDVNNLVPPFFLTDEEKKVWPEKNAVCNIDIIGDDVIYMEVDKYNSMDEIAPYSENTSNAYRNDYNGKINSVLARIPYRSKCDFDKNNDYCGKVNSAFSKIPLINSHFNRIVDSKHDNLMNVSFYEPPLKKLRRLKFKFRYHDGRLVNFKCLPLSFTLEFNMLRDEQLRSRNVRISNLYN